MIHTVVIFGADSEPGYRLAQRVVAAGLRSVAVIRGEREREVLARTGSEPVSGDPLDRASVDAILAAQPAEDVAVVCLLGGTPQLNTAGNINVIEGAAAAGVRRFVLTTSIGCGESVVALDPFVKAIAGRAIRAKDWAERRLRETDMDWTIVRSGGTTRRGGSGAILVDDHRVAGHIGLTDLGDMLFLALSSEKTIHRALAAVDRARAFTTTGNPVIPAEL